MAKIHRLNNKAGRCGDALAISCSCTGACQDMCNLNIAEDLDVYFEGLKDCPGCDSGYAAVFNGNTFQLTHFGGTWVYYFGDIALTCFCVGPGGGHSIGILAFNPHSAFCNTVVKDCFPQLINNRLTLPTCCDTPSCIMASAYQQRCYGGTALVSIH